MKHPLALVAAAAGISLGAGTPAPEHRPATSPSWFRTFTEMLALRNKKAEARAEAAAGRMVACCYCKLGSVAPLIRLERVHPIIARLRQANGDAKGRLEYVHADCAPLVHKKHRKHLESGKVTHVKSAVA